MFFFGMQVSILNIFVSSYTDLHKMYQGKRRGFGQKFTTPEPSEYPKVLIPDCGDYVRSEIHLSNIREDVKGFRSLNIEENSPLVKLASTRAKKAFALDKAVPLLHLNDVRLQDLPIWNSSPGLPWNQIGYKTKADIRDDPDAWNKVRWFWHRVKCNKPVTPSDCCACVGAHLVEKGDVKCRAVWGYPATIVFGEAVFAIPLINAYSSQSSPIAYGSETGVGGMKKLVQQMKGNYYLALDYSSFDKTVPEWLIRRAFDILFFNLDFVTYKDYGVPRFDGIMRMWNFIIDYFINTPIRLCNGERYKKRSSIASDSYFTQLIGSIVNYILLECISIKLENPIMSAKVLGGDSICGFEKPICPSEVDRILAPLGFSVNIEKVSILK